MYLNLLTELHIHSLPLSGTNRFNCFTCDRDTCRECGNAEMADAKNIKDDPLVLAKSIMKHRGSRDSAKVNFSLLTTIGGPWYFW